MALHEATKGFLCNKHIIIIISHNAFLPTHPDPDQNNTFLMNNLQKDPSAPIRCNNFQPAKETLLLILVTLCMTDEQECRGQRQDLLEVNGVIR